MGVQIGPLIVLGPTPEFFDQQFKKLEDSISMKNLETRLTSRALDEILFSQDLLEKRAEREDASPLGGDPTSPENEVSTVIALPWKNSAGVEEIYLLTADVGCEGLTEVVSKFEENVKSLRWMQIPHHGSRRNMNSELIEHFSPKTSFISCEGSVKHPSRKLVNALKAQGGTVYSTHYCVTEKGWLRQTVGEVPDLSTIAATPLYDKG